MTTFCVSFLIGICTVLIADSLTLDPLIASNWLGIIWPITCYGIGLVIGAGLK